MEQMTNGKVQKKIAIHRYGGILSQWVGQKALSSQASLDTTAAGPRGRVFCQSPMGQEWKGAQFLRTKQLGEEKRRVGGTGLGRGFALSQLGGSTTQVTEETWSAIGDGNTNNGKKQNDYGVKIFENAFPRVSSHEIDLYEFFDDLFLFGMCFQLCLKLGEQCTFFLPYRFASFIVPVARQSRLTLRRNTALARYSVSYKVFGKVCVFARLQTVIREREETPISQ